MTAPRRLLGLLLAGTALFIAALPVQSASAACHEQPQFGICGWDIQWTADEAGAAFTQAAGHPYAIRSRIRFNTRTEPLAEEEGAKWPSVPVKDTLGELPPGLIGVPTVVGKCTLSQLNRRGGITDCPPSSQVGFLGAEILLDPPISKVGLYAMEAPPGVPARFGAQILGTVVILDARLRSEGDYGISVESKYISEGLPVKGVELVFWGSPADPVHTPMRACPGERLPTGLDDSAIGRGPACDAGIAPNAFLRLPTACTPAGEGLDSVLRASSWFDPASYNADGSPNLSDPAWLTATSTSHLPPGGDIEEDPAKWGSPQGPTGCDAVPFKPSLTAHPTALDTRTPTGLTVSVDVPQPGLTNPEGIGTSDVKKVTVALPEGVTINPSQAEGLGACSPARYQSTELSFFPTPGTGCPDDSKIGTVEVKTPLLEETLPGDVYIAAPYDNPFGSLLALYVVIKSPETGVMVKLAGKVDTDPRTGQITTTFDDLPQTPFSSFEFKFREGARAPLVTPPACGTYETEADFVPHSDPGRIVTTTSQFQIVHGVGGGPCPSGGLPPFKPGLIAGTLNPNAGSFSPFNLRLFRSDAEQEFTNFSIKLPPGVVGKLAGVPFCPDAAIAAAKGKSGSQELATPSCPKASEVGRTLVGAGVGSVLTYVPGKVYLAGPYNGSALSVAAITSAKVGPFDVGTVVIREALKVNPETAEVFIDPTGSDPIPHIIKGITVHARDIRVYVDKPDFVLNPTSCERTSTASTVLGSGLDFASSSDDNPITVTSPFQAANCASLGFKPKLSLSLQGATKRGENPKFKAVLRARKGDANIGAAQVTLPHSAFLDNEHIKTICTRAQFKEGTVPGEKCPAASIYGYAKAETPLLDEPLQGPVFLRSSSHNLPDLLVALHSGKINVNLAGRIDSVRGGRIRNTFEAVPDAPVTKFTLTMQGGKKGLLVNSTNLCKSTNRAIAAFTGQNGKVHNFNPVVKPSCKGKRAKKKR